MEGELLAFSSKGYTPLPISGLWINVRMTHIHLYFENKLAFVNCNTYRHMEYKHVERTKPQIFLSALEN